MQGLAKQQAIARLRDRIEGIEKRPALTDSAATTRRDVGAASFALPSGLLHEVFTDTPRNGGAMLGFALGAARGLLTDKRPVVLYVQIEHEAAETGLPYGAGLATFGLDPDAVILIRTTSAIELLWAAEEALACKAVAAVIADVGSDPKALDFTASRRLNLRAAETDNAVMLLRYGSGRAASAARMRWHLSPAPSGNMPFDPRAPGPSRWRLLLEKGLWRGKPNGEWLLGWTRNGFDILDIPDAIRTPAAAPLPRAVPAALGDRLSQTA